MRTTSIEAKQTFDSSGKKEAHYNMILEALGSKVLSTMAISELCPLDRHQVARRAKELVLNGRIEEVGKRRCEINRARVLHYRKPSEILTLF